MILAEVSSPAFVPRVLSAVDYIALTVYFALNLGIGWWCARRRRGSSKDFFLGGGRVVWWAAAISFFATSTSSISFMALPAKTYTSNWLVFGSAPAQGLAGVVVGLVFVRLLRRLNMTTVYGYLERRFDKRVQLLGAGLGVLLKVFGRMSVIMLLPSLALSTVTGMNVHVSILLIGVVTTIYALEGGFEAVIWTDVMQAGVMLGGVIIALFYLGGGVSGGLSAVVTAASSHDKFHLFSTELSITEPTVLVFVGQFLATIFVQIGDQPLMQRMLAVPDEAEAKRTVITGNIIGCVGSIGFFFVGTSLWGFYRANPARLATGLSTDAIFPYFIANELPAGVVGVIIAGLFAATMGALSSNINATAAIVVTDFQGTFRPLASEAQRLRVARLTTVACGGLTMSMASYLATKGSASLWDEFMKLIALIGGGFPGVFALGLMTRRAHATGVIIGALASIAVTWWVQTYTTTSVFLHSFVAITTCVSIGYIASCILKPRGSAKNLRGLVLRELPETPRAKPVVVV